MPVFLSLCKNLVQYYPVSDYPWINNLDRYQTAFIDRRATTPKNYMVQSKLNYGLRRIFCPYTNQRKYYEKSPKRYRILPDY